MNIFEELKPQIEAFTQTRDHIVDTITLAPIREGMSCGEPPFAVDDGTSYYAVINEDEEVSPLPFGYQVDDVDMQDDGVDYLLSIPVAAVGGGMTFARYVPLVEDFKIPGDRAFCLETAEDSEAWEAVGKIVDTIQQVVSAKALLNFNQRLSHMISSIYEGCEELESVDQAIAALALKPSTLPTLLLRSYQHALDAIEAEMSDAEGEEDE